MILHVVLFTPRATLTARERHDFAASLESALTGIPGIRRFRVGRRVRSGAAYDGLGDFEYVGVIEFDDLNGLSAYLRHPRHEALGRLFYETASSAFAGDFDAVDHAPAAALDRWQQDRST